MDQSPFRRTKTRDEIDHCRRRFFGAAVMTIAAAQLGIDGSADAQTNEARPTHVPIVKSGANNSFGSLRRIDAGLPRRAATAPDESSAPTTWREASQGRASPRFQR
jgi:hypothetical protein